MKIPLLAFFAFATLFFATSAFPAQHDIKHGLHHVLDGHPTNNSGYPKSSLHNTTLPDVIRGVNIGNWLILEKWMGSTIFEGNNATDQYTFDCTNDAESKIKSHWETFFTEKDVKKIASWGINSLRIPIGYWAFSNDTTPYIRGADAYLEKAIQWARKYHLKVLVDCHGSPGSQNGFDNSGRSGQVKWQSGGNMAKSIEVLKAMARKYGAKEYADVVFGIELVNEPISWGQNNFNLTRNWAQKAYHAVKEVATNGDLIVVMHDSFRGPPSWTAVGASLNGNVTKHKVKFAIDTHLYQNMVANDSSLDQTQHIAKACAWKHTELLPASSNLPVFVGEFSAATNICVNPDGSTVAGSECSWDGCQCSSNVPIEHWRQPLVEVTRKFLEAELDAFEHSARGWFLWSYKAPGGWGMENLVRYGVVGGKVTDRMYHGQCDFTATH